MKESLLIDARTPSGGDLSSVLLSWMQQCTDIIKNSPKEYYRCFEDYVLTHGKTYESCELTKEESDHVKQVLKTPAMSEPRPKMCFFNSQMVVLADRKRKLRYVEGFSLEIIPIHHGWVTLNGKVVDVTFRPQRMGVFEGAYYGVEFSRNQILNYMNETDCLGSLIDDPVRRFPLMRKT